MAFTRTVTLLVAAVAAGVLTTPNAPATVTPAAAGGVHSSLPPGPCRDIEHAAVEAFLGDTAQCDNDEIAGLGSGHLVSGCHWHSDNDLELNLVEVHPDYLDTRGFDDIVTLITAGRHDADTFDGPGTDNRRIVFDGAVVLMIRDEHAGVMLDYRDAHSDLDDPEVVERITAGLVELAAPLFE